MIEKVICKLCGSFVKLNKKGGMFRHGWRQYKDNIEWLGFTNMDIHTARTGCEKFKKWKNSCTSSGTDYYYR